MQVILLCAISLALATLSQATGIFVTHRLGTKNPVLFGEEWPLMVGVDDFELCDVKFSECKSTSRIVGDNRIDNVVVDEAYYCHKCVSMDDKYIKVVNYKFHPTPNGKNTGNCWGPSPNIAGTDLAVLAQFILNEKGEKLQKYHHVKAFCPNRMPNVPAKKKAENPEKAEKAENPEKAEKAEKAENVNISPFQKFKEELAEAADNPKKPQEFKVPKEPQGFKGGPPQGSPQKSPQGYMGFKLHAGKQEPEKPQGGYGGFKGGPPQESPQEYPQGYMFKGGSEKSSIQKEFKEPAKNAENPQKSDKNKADSNKSKNKSIKNIFLWKKGEGEGKGKGNM